MACMFSRRVALELVAESGVAHHGLLASRLGGKASRNPGTIHFEIYRNLVKSYIRLSLTSLVRHILIGFAASALCMAIVLAFDIGYRREMFLGFSDGMRFLIYLSFLNWMVFAGVSAVVMIMWKQTSGYWGYIGTCDASRLQLFRPRNFFLLGIVLFIVSIQYSLNFVTFPWPDAPAHIQASDRFHGNLAFLIFFASVAVVALGFVWLLVLLGWKFSSPKRDM